MTPEEALRDNLANAWRVIREHRDPKEWSRHSIRAQYEYIWQGYNTPNGQKISAPERWVLSGAVS